jgi:hypothetical protein
MQGEGKNGSQTYRRRIYTWIQEKALGLLVRIFRVVAYWLLKKTLKMFVLSFHAGIARDRLLGPYFLPQCLTGAVHHDWLRNVLP